MEKQDIPTQVSAARQGSEPALAALIAHAMPVIRRCARRAAGPGLDFDDAVQEGIIGLLSAIEHYDPDKNATFNTYAGVCIQNAVYSAKKAAGRKKHAPLNQSVPIPEQHGVPGPEDQAIASEQVNQTLARARMVLSPLEKAVLRLYLDGYSYSQIAGRLGRDEKVVDNALARVRRKLR